MGRIPGWAWAATATCLYLGVLGVAVTGRLAGSGFPFVFLVFIPIWHRNWTHGSLLKGLTPVKDDVGLENHAVRITLYRDGILYGEDVGWARFINGSMFFEGSKTAFSFEADAVRAVVADALPKKERKGRETKSESPYQVHWEHAGHAHCLAITSLDEYYSIGSNPFRTKFEEWRWELSNPSSVSVLPPILPAADAARLRALHRFNLDAYWTWLVGSVTLVWVGDYLLDKAGVGLTPIQAVLALLGVLFAAVFYLRSRQRA
jgi:hypothetical protein